MALRLSRISIQNGHLNLIRRFRLELSLFILIISFINPLFSQDISFKKFGVSEGLSSNTVFSSVEDKEGYIWISTEEGVDRFDGNNFRHYDLPKLYEYRSANYVEYKLKIDANNRIWLITLGGLLYIYEPNKDEFVLFYTIDDDSVQEVNAFYIDHLNQLWIGVNNGVLVFDPSSKQINRITTVVTRTSSVIQDDSHNYYLGTEDGIDVLDSHQNFLYDLLEKTNRMETGLRGSQIASLYYDKHNKRLWVGSNKLGLCEFNLVNFEFNIPKGLSEYKGLKVRSIVPFTQNEIIVGIDGEGLLIWDLTQEKEVKKITPHQDNTGALSSASVHHVFRSSSNVFFISTFRGGLNVYSPGNLNFGAIRHYIYKDNSLRNNVVLSLFEVRPGIIGFGTDKGISIWDKNSDRWSHLEVKLNNENHISNSRSISVDKQHTIWSNSYTDSIVTFKQGGGSEFYTSKNFNPALRFINANKVHASKGDLIWFSEDETKRIYYYSLKTEKLEHYPSQIGNVQAMMYCEPDILAIGTATGLKILDIKSGHLKDLDIIKTSRLNSAMISSLILDVNKQLWVGTRYEGLFVVNLFNNSILRLTTSDGLLSNRIFSLASDSLNVWASSAKSLARIDNLLNVTNFTKSDGLISVDFNYDAAITDSEGTIYFGTNDGVITFNPSEIKPVESKKSILFTDLYLNHQKVLPGINSPLDTLLNATEFLELEYDQNSFSFGFTSIDFMHFDKGIFHWKLENFDENWISNSGSNVASYTNLNPGKYIFKLKMTGQKDELIAPIKQISLLIKPPFWQTPLAYIIYVVLLLILIGLILYAYRLRITAKHSRNKLHYLANMAHEIKTPLMLIKAPLNDLIQNGSLDTSLKSNINMALKNAEKVHLQLIQFLDFRKLKTNKNNLNPQPLDLIWLLKDKIFAFKILADKKNISLHLKTKPSNLLLEADENVLDKVISNLLSNAIKYTLEGGSVKVELKVKDKVCEILVKDTGIGIPIAERKKIFRLFYRANNAKSSGSIGTGVGLVLACDLARLVKGNVSLVKSSEYGSVFSFKFPFKPISNLIEFSKSSCDIDISEQGQDPTRKKAKILLVEDDPDLIAYSSNRLSNAYHVITANNGLTAQEIIKNDLPDIILCDILMPKMNGLQLCMNLKKNIETCHIPIILFSGLGSRENIIQGLESGADDYIVKPYDYELLQHKIEGYLNNRQILKRRFLVFNEEDEAIEFTNRLDDKFISDLTHLVEENLSDASFTVIDMCEAMGMSRTSFYHKLKGLLDVSPNEFLRTVRLKKGRRMLLDYEYNVSEVAYSVGFSDAKYFGTLFKKYYGQNPSTFVASKRNNFAKESENSK